MRLKRLALCAVIAMCLAAPPALASTWTGSSGLLWNNGGNWNPVGIPDGVDAIINNAGTATLDAVVPDIADLQVSGYSTLNIDTGADLTATGSGNIAVGGASDEGYVDHTSGAVSFGTDLTLGSAATDFGRWTMSSDGTLGVTGDLTVGGSGNGQFDLQGTSVLTVGGNIGIGTSGGSGSLTLTDSATLTQTGGSLTVGGAFAVEGSTPTINVTDYAQTSGGSLNVVLDDFGVSTINASGDLALGGALNVSIAGGASPAPDIYDIIVAQGNRSGGFSAFNLPPGVQFRYGTDTATAKLYVGVEPPPLDDGLLVTDGMIVHLDAQDMTGNGVSSDNPTHGASVDVWADKAVSEGDSAPADDFRSGNSYGWPHDGRPGGVWNNNWDVPQYAWGEVNGLNAVFFSSIQAGNDVLQAGWVDEDTPGTFEMGGTGESTGFLVVDPVKVDRTPTWSIGVGGSFDGAYRDNFGNDGKYDAVTDGSFTENEWHIYTVRVEEVDGQLVATAYLAGLAKQSNDVDGTYSTAPTLARNVDSGTNLSGDTGSAYQAEVILYNRFLTNAEFNDVGLYLANKYDLDFTPLQEELPPPSEIPEPAGLGLVGIALLGLRKRRS